MVDVPSPPPKPALIEVAKASADIRERINIVRVAFAKTRDTKQHARDTKTAQFDNFNQALPFQNFNEFHNFNDFSNFNDFHNFNDFSNR